MSDLWAQFSLDFINVSWSTSTTYPYTPDGPVDDHANSIQTIDGRPYLVSVSTSVYDDYSYGEPLPNGNLSGYIEYLYNQYEGYYPYSTWNESVSASPASSSVNLSALNDVIPTQVSDENFPNEVIDFGSAPYGEPFEGFELTVSNVENTIELPAGQAPSNLQAPAETYNASAFDLSDNIYYPEYVWVDLGAVSTLFTTGADVVDFNNLTPDQQAAIAGGAALNDGLGGDDVVTLPNVANYNESVGDGETLGWNPSQTFTTGSLAGQTYTVNGGDGSYNIALGAGNDSVTINGNGNSTITAGSGTDTVTITGNGNNSISLGPGTDAVTISGTGNNTISAGTGASDLTITQFAGQLTGSSPSPPEGASVDITGPSSGTVTIGSRSTLELSAPFTGEIAFGSASGGILQIDGANIPSNPITGFIAGDLIDFKSVSVASLVGAVISETNTELQSQTNSGTDNIPLVEGSSDQFDYAITNDSSGGADLTAEESPGEGVKQADLLLDLFSTLLSGVTALKEYSGGLTVEDFEKNFGPVFAALGATIDGNAVYQQLQTDLANAGDNLDAQATAWDNAQEAALNICIKAGLKGLLSLAVSKGAAAATTAGLNFIAGFAAEGAIGEWAAALAIGAGVVEAPIVIGAVAAFLAGAAFDAYFEKYWSSLVESWVEKYMAQPAPTVNTDSTSNINSGQSSSSVILGQDASLNVLAGGAANNIVIDSGGIENVYGADTSAVIGDGGYQYVFGKATGAVALDPGVQVVTSGGTAVNTTIYGGEQDVYGTASGADVESGGLQIVENGGTANNTTVNTNGVAVIDSGGVLQGNTVIGGGTVEAQPGAVVGGDIDFSAAGGTLQVDGVTSLTNLINGFANDSIVLERVTYALGDHAVFTSNGSGGGTVAVDNIDGTQIASFNVEGDYQSSQFSVSEGAQGAVAVRGPVFQEPAEILWRNTNGGTELWNPNGTGGFTFDSLGVVNTDWQIAGTGDFAGTGEAGILWRNTNGGTELWNPNGTGGFTFDSLGVVNTDWQIAGTGDFAGTGEAGILWRNTNGGTELWNPNGSGGFTFDSLGVVNTDWQIAGTGDFNGNGEDGVLWRNSTNGDAEIWSPNGSGGFTYDNLGPVNSSWQIAGTGDFTGTGQDSILWRNTSGGTELWNPNGSGGFTYQNLGVVNTSWQVAETGDFTGSGQSGILWRNTNGDTELWNPNGSGGFTYQDLGVVSTSWTVQKIFA